jgi:hypothetical protein
VYWDDLQLLRLIDDLETSEQLSDLSNGYNLMQRAAQGKTIDWNQDTTSFAPRHGVSAVPNSDLSVTLGAIVE